MTTARVRGIYATALTALLDDAVDIVEASAPIQQRFDRSFDRGEPGVTVETTADRQGVGIHGEPDTVETVGGILGAVATDTFRWRAAAPQDAVFVGEVVDTTGGGAIVDLGAREGYLPFDDVAGYVDVDDVRLVQVESPAPPWAEDRPVLTTDIRLQGALVTLVSGVSGTLAATPETESDRELAGLTDLIDPDIPAEWGIRWERAAADASVDTLREALDRQLDRIDPLLDVPEDAEAAATDQQQIAAPSAGIWVWFGRSSRTSLDDIRAHVQATITGHHRIKAGGRNASGAVDFAERLGTAVETFPVGAVLEQFGPQVDDRLRIRHGKPDGRCYALGSATVTDRDTDDGSLTVEREIRSSGTYDALDVERAAGDVATTRFREGRWWYPTTYRSSEGTLRGTYLNVNTPLELFPDAVRYVDLHVDVVKWPDGEVTIVDEDEVAAAVEAGHLSSDLADRALDVASNVADAVRD